MLAQAFGLDLRFDSPTPPGAWAERTGPGASLRIAAASAGELEEAWSGTDEIGWEATIDGLRFAAEVGVSGDHRFRRGEATIAHLDADAEALLFDPGDPVEAVGRWRLLLDSVLFSVALLRGFEALHAGGVLLDGRAVAIAAGAGGGKSTLLARLLADGAELLSDDVVVLGPEPDGSPRAHPGPPLMTVPMGLPSPPGEPIAELGGEEEWRAVPVGTGPAPLGAIVLLDRAAGGTPRLEALEQPLSPLLSSLLRFPRTPERERSRFELAATLAGTVPVLALSAGPGATPAELAATLRGLDFDTDRRRH